MSGWSVGIPASNAILGNSATAQRRSRPDKSIPRQSLGTRKTSCSKPRYFGGPDAALSVSPRPSPLVPRLRLGTQLSARLRRSAPLPSLLVPRLRLGPQLSARLRRSPHKIHLPRNTPLLAAGFSISPGKFARRPLKTPQEISAIRSPQAEGLPVISRWSRPAGRHHR
jgi:hypothetical protein